MNLISIHYGHNCTVAYSENGTIKFAQSEERILGMKNATGFPYKTLNHVEKNYLNKNFGTEILLIDETGLGAQFLLEHGLNPKKYQIILKEKNFFTKVIKKIFRFFFSLFGPKKVIEKITGINTYKVNYFNHHLCHAATPCLFKDFDEKKKWLIFTLDAEGDNVSSGIYQFSENKIHRISFNDRNKSLGYIYSYTTEILGMNSNEHEFKVMGMAPYGNSIKKKEIANKLKNELVSFDQKSGEFLSKCNFVDFRKVLKKIYFQESFEDICAGVQFYLEEIVCLWVSFWIKKTNIKNIALSGGVFMNVKASKKISEIDIVESQFVTPSCSDESLVFGAIYLKQKKNNNHFNKLDNLYLGEDFNSKLIYETFIKSNWKNFFEIQELEIKDLNFMLAKYLSEKKIIGRFFGRSEWGARALGNRSILCDPRDKKNIDLLNQKIKSRDYWMPFAPSILFEDTNLYYENKKKINCDFMQMSFDATEYAKKNIAAAIHPKDFTLRPQAVRKEINPYYYDLITNFKKITGIGCLLNTSFNLHGNPNVGKPEHAFYTFFNSGLDILNIENFVFLKKNNL